MSPTTSSGPRRTRRAPRLALGALGLIAAAAAAVGLIDRIAAGPDGWSARPPADAPLPEDARKVRLGLETRNAWRVSGAAPVPWPLDGRGPRAVELAFGLGCPAGETCDGRYRFTARLVGDGRAETVHEAFVDAGDDPHWHVARVELPAATGGPQRLVLSAEREGGGLGALFAPRAEAYFAEPLDRGPGGAPDRPNVLLVSIDTLRADRLGAYGYGRGTSPRLDALAAEGIRFERAISQAPWTTPSHMSLMTSLHPSTHGLNQDWSRFKAHQAGTASYPALSRDVATLAERLQAAGWRTLAQTGGGTVGSDFGFARGFDVYRDGPRRLDDAARGRVEDWLDAFATGTPTFLFFHTFEVHAAYTHPHFARDHMTPEQAAALDAFLAEDDSDHRIGELARFLRRHGLMRPEITSALYDGGIRYTDGVLGEIFDGLRRRGLWDRTIVVVTSDHGEEFADHDPSRFYDAHCRTLYDELVRVPLIIRAPGGFAPGVVDAPVELVDVAPTLLELLGLPVPAAMQGESLVTWMAGRAPADDTALSEATCVGPEWKALRTRDEKYIAGFDVAEVDRSGIPGPLAFERLFDLAADPGEQRDLAAADPDRARAWRARVERRFEALRAERGEAASRPVAGDTIESLRALGYVD